MIVGKRLAHFLGFHGRPVVTAQTPDGEFVRLWCPYCHKSRTVVANAYGQYKRGW